MRAELAGMWKKITSPILSKIPRLPRPWRIVRNLVCIVLAVYLAWLFAGGNALTAKWAFRRAERLAMVGPSELLHETRDGDEVVLVGRTEYGYYIARFAKYANPLGGWYKRNDVYAERQETVTFSVARPDPGTISQPYVELLIFCDDPAVCRGEAEVTISGSGSLNGRSYEFDKTYTVEFLPTADGMLSGRVAAETADDSSWDGLLEQVMLDGIYNVACPVTVRLYGEDGQLLYQEEFEYRYPRY